MANIHGSEPQAQGLVTFKTNFGDIDIELFTKQCPKVAKNFVQFCLDGYYSGSSFTRVEKDFIAVAGDSEEDTEFEHVPDEFHSRLKFTRRGLLATANTKKDENGPAFFFTLGPTPELQNKHTIFGRVVGNTVFSLVDLNECQVDDDLRPTTDKVITEVLVKENPFPNLVPRSNSIKRSSSNKQTDSSESLLDDYDPLAKPKIDPYKLKKLSFPEDYDEEEEDEVEYKNSRQVSTKPETKADSKNPSQQPESVFDQSRVKEHSKSTNSEGTTKVSDDDNLNAREQRLREIREQIKNIKEQIEREPDIKTLSERRQMSIESQTSEQTSADSRKLEDSVDGIQLRIAGKKSRHRERETIEIVTNFKKKLRKVASDEPKFPKQLVTVENEFDLDELAALDKVDGDDWLNHKFDADNDEVRLAKDANTKDECWYSVDDPRRDMKRKEHYNSSDRSYGRQNSDRSDYRPESDDRRHRHRSPERNSSSSRHRH